MVSPSAGYSAPASSTSRVCTPSSGRPTQPGRRSPSASVLRVISDSVLPYRSTGAWPVSSTRPSNTGTGSAALPDTSSRRRRQRAAASGSATTRDHTVGTPKNSVPPAERGLRVGLRRRFSGVHEAISDPQRSEQTQHQAVHVEQRQSVHQDVVGCPLPGLRQRVDVGGDRTSAGLHSLGRAGGAGGVHDVGRRVRRRFGVAVPGPGVQPDRNVRQAREVVGQFAQPRLRAGIGQDVGAFGDADVGGHRNERHAGDQAARRRPAPWRPSASPARPPGRGPRRVRPPRLPRRPGHCGSARSRRC